MDASPFAKLSPELRLRICELALQQPDDVEVGHNISKKYDARLGLPALRLQEDETELQPYQINARETLQPIDPDDVKIKQRADTAYPLAIVQTCRQLRKEATDIFYNVNNFSVDMYAQTLGLGASADGRMMLGVEYEESDQYLALTLPVAKLLEVVERQCENARSQFPSMKITIFIVHLETEMRVRATIDKSMRHILLTLIAQTRAYNEKGWEIDLAVETRVFWPRMLSGPKSKSVPLRIAINGGPGCLDNLVKDVTTLRDVYLDRYREAISWNLLTFERWRQIWAS